MLFFLRDDTFIFWAKWNLYHWKNPRENPIKIGQPSFSILVKIPANLQFDLELESLLYIHYFIENSTEKHPLVNTWEIIDQFFRSHV